MHIQADRVLIPAGSPVVRYVSITVSAPERPRGPAPNRGSDAAAQAGDGPPARAGAEVALVLDRSGSMDGEKIRMARLAVEHAVRLLDSRDHLAVVIYDNEVETLLGRTRASGEAKRMVLRRLARADARGGTNLSGGWLAGADEVRPGPLTDPPGAGAAPTARRVLLVTDGLANGGIVDPDALAAEAARLRAEGVSTSTFGVGADFDEVLLERLASTGGGHFYYIETARQIPDYLASELGETLDVMCQDVVLTLAPGPGVEVTVLNGFATDSVDGVSRVRLGDLVAGQEVQVVLALSFEPQRLAREVHVDCSVSEAGADGGRMSLRTTPAAAPGVAPLPMRVTWRAVTPGENDRQSVNRDVLVAAAELLAERGRATALAANREGRYDEAARVLGEIATQLQAIANDDPRVTALVDGLRADEREFAAAMNPAMLKSRHFAAHRVAYSRTESGRARKREP
ncbi:MAG: VWA domain-containing protein [Vicinamibacterales bacterium]